MSDARERALDLIEQGIVAADHMVLMCMKWMTPDDVEEMLDANELSERFMEDEEEDDIYDDDGYADETYPFTLSYTSRLTGNPVSITCYNQAEADEAYENMFRCEGDDIEFSVD